ncbi:MAG: hypothetical protein UDG94_05380 [Peptococcaceae bacterium]|nr:hypothetical protein [Peptococcaceae bacterium]
MSNKTRLEYLKKRKKHCCCKYCGGPLEIRRMVFSSDDDARVELYCPNCSKIEFGVEKEIFSVAEYYVEEIGFQGSGDVDHAQLKRQMNVAKVADIISWGFDQLGYIDESGFKHPVEVKDDLLHEYLEQIREQQISGKGDERNGYVG